jgi:hypothetical protein
MKTGHLPIALALALSAGSAPAATRRARRGAREAPLRRLPRHRPRRPQPRTGRPAAQGPQPPLRPEQLGEALAEGLLVGHPMMPEFRFRADDVKSILLYLKSIQTREGG